METSRELDARWPTMTEEEKRSIFGDRHRHFTPLLKGLLRPGDKLRGQNGSTCTTGEATFTFSHWEGETIVSKSGRSVQPSMVYSVNGEILR